MQKILLFSLFILASLISVNEVYADHDEVTIVTADGSGAPGCEEIQYGCFIPGIATVDLGGLVIFSNTDSAAHTFTAGTPAGNTGEFDSSMVMLGESYEWSADVVGEIDYWCMVHPWMIGLLIVESAVVEETVVELTINSFEIYEDGDYTRYHVIGDAPASTNLTFTMTKPDGSNGDYNGSAGTGQPSYNQDGLVSPTSNLVYGTWNLEICAAEHNMCVEESFTINQLVTPVFTTVSSINGQGNSCLGFENLPVGTQSVWLLGPQQGNSAYYYQGSQWYGGTHNISSSSSFFDGVSCQSSTNHRIAGEYKYAALSHPTASPLDSNIMEFSTTLVLDEYQLVNPTVISPADITQTTDNSEGTIVTFSASGIAGSIPIAQGYPICAKFDSSTGFSGIEASGTMFPVGETTVICQAYDIGGNSSGNVEFTVTILYEESTPTDGPFTLPCSMQENGDGVSSSSCHGFYSNGVARAEVGINYHSGLFPIEDYDAIGFFIDENGNQGSNISITHNLINPGESATLVFENTVSGFVSEFQMQMIGGSIVSEPVVESEQESEIFFKIYSDKETHRLGEFMTIYVETNDPTIDPYQNINLEAFDENGIYMKSTTLIPSDEEGIWKRTSYNFLDGALNIHPGIWKWKGFAGDRDIEFYTTLTNDILPSVNGVIFTTDKTQYEQGEPVNVHVEMDLSTNKIELILFFENGYYNGVFDGPLKTDGTRDVVIEPGYFDRASENQPEVRIWLVDETNHITTQKNILYGINTSIPSVEPEPIVEPEPDYNNQVTIVPTQGSGAPGCEEVLNGCYIPGVAAVNVGGTVIFSNTDTAAHTFTSGTPADGPTGLFDTSMVMAGQSYSWTANTAGQMDYFCMVHPWMVGTILVGGTTYVPPVEPEPVPEPVPTSITLRTNGSTYDEGDTIIISGNVYPIIKNIPVTLQIFSDNKDLVNIAQVTVTNSGSYSHKVLAKGPLWDETMTVIVKTSYGNETAERDFKFIKDNYVPEPIPESDSKVTIIPAQGSGAPGCEEVQYGCYIPGIASVNLGGTITFSNTDSAAHTFSAGSAANGPTGEFDTSMVMAGQSYEWTADTSGVIPYFCMVHPWMTGLVVVGEGTYIPPTPVPQTPITLKVSTGYNTYDIGDLVLVLVKANGFTGTQKVAVDVTDPRGNTVVSRSINLASNITEDIGFRLSEDFKTGTYRVTATTNDSGDIISSTSYFKIKSQFNSFTISAVTATDQQGNTSTLDAGEMGFIKVNLKSNKSIATLVTVNLFDSELTSMGIGSVKTTLSSGESEIILSFMIPEDAAIGPADIYVNAFSDWPSSGGIPLTNEVSVMEDIQ